MESGYLLYVEPFHVHVVGDEHQFTEN